MSRRLLAIVVLLALLACASTVEARHKRAIVELQSPPTASTPHPEEVADDATRANWARIRAEYERNNYTMPGQNDLAAGDQLGAAFGVDVSSWVGINTWNCIKEKGYTFGIVRAYQQICAPDPNGVHTVANAWAAGIKYMDIYLFPSYGCARSAAQQVDAAIDSMGTIPFGKLWLDIEAGGHRDYASNHAWMTQAIARGVQRLGVSRIGIYSSQYMWGLVMGNLPGPGTQYQAWYAHYNGQPNFNGYMPFGGWSRPSMKQYAGDVGLCGANVDLNWY